MRQLDSWSHYASPRNAMRRFLLSCHGAGEQSGHLRPFRRRVLPTRGLVYVSAGSGMYEEHDPRDTRQTVEGPAVIWLAPGVMHGYGPDAAGWSEHWVLFEGEAYAAFEAGGLAAPRRAVQPLSRPIDAAPVIFGDLRDALAAVGPRSELAASVAVQRLLLAILDATDPAGAPVPEASAVDVVVRDAVLPLSVAERAAAVGLTPRELAAAVRGATGLPVNEYVIEVRIARARELLAGTRLDVGQVANRVGYDDAAYFSRLFRRRTGVAPSVFRAQQARPAEV